MESILQWLSDPVVLKWIIGILLVIIAIVIALFCAVMSFFGDFLGSISKGFWR